MTESLAGARPRGEKARTKLEVFPTHSGSIFHEARSHQSPSTTTTETTNHLLEDKEFVGLELPGLLPPELLRVHGAPLQLPGHYLHHSTTGRTTTQKNKQPRCEKQAA